MGNPYEDIRERLARVETLLIEMKEDIKSCVRSFNILDQKINDRYHKINRRVTLLEIETGRASLKWQIAGFLTASFVGGMIGYLITILGQVV